MERRMLGRTGRELSIVGMGGVVLVGMTQDEANAIVREAIDRGVNYFDVAPSYGRDQETEKRLGPALEGHRETVFLACKTMERTAAGAREELHRSLRHLHTGYLDLYQLHALSKIEEVETIFGPGGAIEAFLKAREAGLVRYLGFSAHSEAAALAALERFPFDTALFPLNFVTYYAGGFGARILARAQEQGVARLALKSMARTNWQEGAPRPFPHCWYEPISDPALAGMALRFTLSEPITAAIAPGDPALFRMALDLADAFRPLTSGERAELEAYARTVAPIFKTVHE